jgi:hypothetical protein
MSAKGVVEPIQLRGRHFSTKDLKVIQRLVEKHYKDGRTCISREVCKKLDWKQPNGWLKDRACREVLRALHDKKIIKLPKSKKKIGIGSPIHKPAALKIGEMLAPKDLIEISLGRIKFIQVKGTKNEVIWNEVVNKYHYLGFKTFVGRSLKYLILHDELIIGAIGFCDPAWQLAQRDEICKEIGILKSEVRLKGINNGRFLILPWIKVPNLASFVLSKTVKLVRQDWEKYYTVLPAFIETFVDPKKFYGTCYKADNWSLIGKSKGYKKSGANYSNSQIPKLIFIKFFKESLTKKQYSKISTYGISN